MKSPVNYYGGKAQLVSTLLPMIGAANKTGYGEVFAGGASLLFAKAPQPYEVLNDINGNVACFYQVMKTRYIQLKREIDATIFCESTFAKAKAIYNTPEGIPDVLRAWAFWAACNMGFSGQPDSVFQYIKNKGDNWTPATRLKNKKAYFEKYIARLDKVTVFNRDAVELIKMLDSPDMLWFADPPYVGANQGHYKGYSQDMFNNLIDTLVESKGAFILTSYPNAYLKKHAHLFHTLELDMRKGCLGDYTRKTEVITCNFKSETYQQIKMNL